MKVYIFEHRNLCYDEYGNKREFVAWYTVHKDLKDAVVGLPQPVKANREDEEDVVYEDAFGRDVIREVEI